MYNESAKCSFKEFMQFIKTSSVLKKLSDNTVKSIPKFNMTAS